MEERILYPSIWLKIFIPFLGLAGGILGYQLFIGEEHFPPLFDNVYHREGWGIFLLIGSVIIVMLGLLNLLPHACFLKLDADKLTAVIFFYRQELSWKDVDNFRTFRFQPNARYRVVADVHEDTALPPKKSEPLQNRYGFDFLLPCSYGMPAQKLANLLNEWRSRYGRPNFTDDSSHN